MHQSWYLSLSFLEGKAPYRAFPAISTLPIPKHLVIEGEKHPPVLDRERETEAEQENGHQWQS